MNSIISFLKQKPNGYTLLELLTTISIAVILSTIGFISFSRYLGEEKLKLATRSALTWLEEQRKIAIQADTPCLAVINTTTKSLSNQDYVDDPNSTNPAFSQCESKSSGSIDLSQLANQLEDISICTKILEHETEDDDGNIVPEEMPTDSVQQLALQCTGQTTAIAFSPRGTSLSCASINQCSNNTTLITLSTPTTKEPRCITIISPSGQLRSGKTTGGKCDFKTAY